MIDAHVLGFQILSGGVIKKYIKTNQLPNNEFVHCVTGIFMHGFIH